jgi:hypothetical protein
MVSRVSVNFEVKLIDIIDGEISGDRLKVMYAVNRMTYIVVE